MAQSGPDIGLVLLPLLITFGVLMALGVVIVKALVCCKIFAKAGYCWALGLLMFVPIVNIIMAFVLAFGEWPIQRQLRRLEQCQRQ
ncbi:MAG: hypothetical protein A2Z25_11395 [Planctomycetes bacterium RBG_16_55_9]|nr:MAG: hypothetical protein A2Z25_11395 [Planctomycetes bacterium RBG_16_55_9]